MNQAFLQLLMEKTGFPPEAQKAVLESRDTLAKVGQEEALDGVVEAYRENDFAVGAVEPVIQEIAQASGISPYTLWLMVLTEASLPVRESFLEEGREDLFWETFADLRYKVLECKEIHGVWGNFVAEWYPIFFTRDIVKLGRLEYENGKYEWDEPYECGGITVKKGDPVKWIHIPSSGEPFGKEARLASYRQAYEYFKPERKEGEPLICACHSWLLYPPYGKILPPDSNIVSFQQDFHLVFSKDSKEFYDAWRLFGRDYQKPTAQLPEDTSMRRAFKQYLLAGGTVGEGRGVFVFDGEKIVSSC